MDHIDKFAATVNEISKPQPVRRGAWSSMNWIQKSGCLLGVLLILPYLIADGRLGIFLGLLSWTSFYVGYVGGGLWKYKHALHFWWSFAGASVVHALLLPIYAVIVKLTKNAPGHEGKLYLYLGFGLLICEVLSLHYATKKIGLRIHHKEHA
ncbi:MAG: hypothetical protein JSS87_08515 [Acidobacteria bacterium]|nr:hypothetical protein [Acidobacteriota bacterium]